MPDAHPAIAAGQLWEDTDPRGGRRFRIVEVEAAHALCKTEPAGRRSRIRLDRFAPGAGTYRLVEEASGAGVPAPLAEVLTAELRARGYRLVDPDAAREGLWTHPSFEGATCGMLDALADCLGREAQAAAV